MGKERFPSLECQNHPIQSEYHTEKNHLGIFVRPDGETSRYFIFDFELPTPFARIVTLLRHKLKIHKTKKNVQEAGL